MDILGAVQNVQDYSNAAETLSNKQAQFGKPQRRSFSEQFRNWVGYSGKLGYRKLTDTFDYSMQEGFTFQFQDDPEYEVLDDPEILQGIPAEFIPSIIKAGSRPEAELRKQRLLEDIKELEQQGIDLRMAPIRSIP